MTRQELAEKINGMNIRDEISKELISQAKESGLVVLFGYSDDNLEAGGAIYDEYGCYEGGEFLLVKEGEMYADNEDENTYHKAECDGLYDASNDHDIDNHSRLIKAEWCPDGNSGVSWRITSNIPNSTFNMYGDEGEIWCEGIVIDLNEVEPIND